MKVCKFKVAAWVVLASCALAVGCGHQSSHTHAQGAMHAMPVAVKPAQLSTVSDSSDYVGTLQSRLSATISSQVVGYIRTINVKSGDHVRASQLLMNIDPLKQQATVVSQQSARAAQAATVAYDEQQLKREEALFEAGVASRQDLDAARTTYNSAKAQLSALDAQLQEQQVQLEYYRITAPRAGIVGDIPVHVGDLVQTNTLLTTVDQPGNLQVYIYVPIERAASLHMGLPVELLDSNGKALATSRIDFISPQVDNTSQTILVKATVGDDRGLLRNQQYVTARVIWDTHPGILVPVLQVLQINGRYFVFVAAPQGNSFVARELPVDVGQIVGNNYVIRSGLHPGDRVITSDTQILADGMPVMPMPAQPGGNKNPAGPATAGQPGQ